MNMTKRRKWESSQKLKIVLEGLSGQGHQAFESKHITKHEQRLQSENQRLKEIIGELTCELKKSEFE